MKEIDALDPIVIGKRLQRARERAGFRQEDAAKIIDVSRTTMVAIEKGERKVRPQEIVALAERFGVTVSSLVVQRPDSESFDIQFRSALYDDAVSAEAMTETVDYFRDLCRDYTYLETLTNSALHRTYPQQYEYESLTVQHASNWIADQERRRLGLGEGPIKSIRQVLEYSVGIKIFYLQMKSPSNVAVSEMYTCNDVFGACMAINVGQPPYRRNWSMAHAFGHFLVDRYETRVSWEDKYRRKPLAERFADEFAKVFLMPAKSVTHAVNWNKSMTGTFKVNNLVFLAHDYHVSVQAMCNRLEELNLVSKGTWETLKTKGIKPNDLRKELGVEEKDENADMLPNHYLELAVSAYDNEQISEEQLAHFLRLDRISAREKAISVRRWSDVATGLGVDNLDLLAGED